MECSEVVNYYRSKGFECNNISVLYLSEYSRKQRKAVLFESFTAVISGLSELDKKRVFGMARACDYYLVPITELDPEHPNNKSGERDSVLAWIPAEMLKTLVYYLEDFERLVKASYDYLQEDEGTVRLTTDLEMVRGYVEHFEACRLQLNTDMANSQSYECPNLLLGHFRGDSKNTFSNLVELIRKLNTQWDVRCPHGKTWKDALDKEWHVDANTRTPLRNFSMSVSEMEKKEEAEKKRRPTMHF